ncbi:hypothetical protein HD553DRAFT_344619 [Filobasidium floriforme]|uniref:uncharacterized protein n=1 Tax=Filobasidium floriforme TaxID=5210 RepID=UPI001E8E392E|nr:uncharacterized protein HD553DRAFT_344619 [Filobasidium floriforme]KAH8080849.1 hypothetical protein HD553DRAFT_344619 [Filobasidium floriforme]
MENNEQPLPVFPGGSLEDYQVWMTELTDEQRARFNEVNERALEQRRWEAAEEAAEQRRLAEEAAHQAALERAQRERDALATARAQIRTLLNVPAHQALVREMLAAEGFTITPIRSTRLLEIDAAETRDAPRRVPAGHPEGGLRHVYSYPRLSPAHLSGGPTRSTSPADSPP